MAQPNITHTVQVPVLNRARGSEWSLPRTVTPAGPVTALRETQTQRKTLPGGRPLFTVEVTRQKTASHGGRCEAYPTPELQWLEVGDRGAPRPRTPLEPAGTHACRLAPWGGAGRAAAPGPRTAPQPALRPVTSARPRAEPLPQPWAPLWPGWRESSRAVRPPARPRLSLAQTGYLLCRMQPKLLFTICDALPIGS